MPEAGTDMNMDRLFEVKNSAAIGTENIPPPSLSSGPSGDILRNFYHTKRVGNYLIGRKLGEGSFAKVREGLHALTGEKVAVKVIDKRKAKKDSYVTKNLRREGQIQQMIRHPNITQLLDILETENSYYLVMELCPGGNLMNHIYEKKRLEEREAQKYIRQLVMAVEHLHRAGVVHRDLKIENLLLDEQDNIKLIDFGLSNCAGILGYSDPFSTQCGSPAYAAPELLSRNKYGPKVDVWSIGVNMYAMLTGTLPFTVEPFNLKALHQRMVDKDMNPLPSSISSAAVSLLKSLLEPDPAKRPNIHQVMGDSWLQLGNPHTGIPYLNRIHIEEINHTVLLHMTERMSYKHSEVLSAVLTNRACHTLAVYFLLNKKMKRLSKEYREKQYSIEKEKKSELFQTQWRKHIEKITIPPKQTPVYLAVSKGPTKEKKQKTGLLKAMTGLKDAYSRQGGCIASSSLEYLEIHPLFPQTSQGGRHIEAQPPKKDGPRAVDVPARPPSSLGAHSWASASKEPSKDDPPSPWYKLTNGALSPPRHVSAFHQPDSSYLKKATIPNVPVVVVKPQPKNSLPTTECHSKPESGSNGGSGGRSGGRSNGGSGGRSDGGSGGRSNGGSGGRSNGGSGGRSNGGSGGRSNGGGGGHSNGGGGGLSNGGGGGLSNGGGGGHSNGGSDGHSNGGSDGCSNGGSSGRSNGSGSGRSNVGSGGHSDGCSNGGSSGRSNGGGSGHSNGVNDGCGNGGNTGVKNGGSNEGNSGGSNGGSNRGNSGHRNGGSIGCSSGGSSGSSNEEPSSPQHRAKFPSMGIGQILKKKVQPFAFPAPLFRPEPAVEVESPTPYHMQTLLCASGALKTLC